MPVGIPTQLNKQGHLLLLEHRIAQLVLLLLLLHICADSAHALAHQPAPESHACTAERNAGRTRMCACSTATGSSTCSSSTSAGTCPRASNSDSRSGTRPGARAATTSAGACRAMTHRPAAPQPAAQGGRGAIECRGRRLFALHLPVPHIPSREGYKGGRGMPQGVPVWWPCVCVLCVCTRARVLRDAEGRVHSHQNTAAVTAWLGQAAPGTAAC